MGILQQCRLEHGDLYSVTNGVTTPNIDISLIGGSGSGSLNGTITLANGAPLVAMPRISYADMLAPIQAQSEVSVAVVHPAQEYPMIRLEDGTIIPSAESGFETVQVVTSEGAPSG